MAEINRLGALQVGVAGHRPVQMLFGAPQQDLHQALHSDRATPARSRV